VPKSKPSWPNAREKNERPFAEKDMILAAEILSGSEPLICALAVVTVIIHIALAAGV
jgi:hypothetical protein